MESLDRKCFIDKLISPFLFKRKISKIVFKMIHNSNKILWILFQFHQKTGKWITRWICAVESPEKKLLLKYPDTSWLKDHIESNYCSIVDWSREVRAPENRNIIFIWKEYWMRKQVFNSSRSSHGIIPLHRKQRSKVPRPSHQIPNFGLETKQQSLLTSACTPVSSHGWSSLRKTSKDFFLTNDQKGSLSPWNRIEYTLK